MANKPCNSCLNEAYGTNIFSLQAHNSLPVLKNTTQNFRAMLGAILNRQNLPHKSTKNARNVAINGEKNTCFPYELK